MMLTEDNLLSTCSAFYRPRMILSNPILILLLAALASRLKILETFESRNYEEVLHYLFRLLTSASFAMEFDGRHCESCTTHMKEARLTCVLWKDIVPASRQQHTLAQKQGRKVKFQNNKST